MKADPGYFRPNSLMWQVNKEITVLFGGARVPLMHAPHPLIASLVQGKHLFTKEIHGKD